MFDGRNTYPNPWHETDNVLPCALMSPSLSAETIHSNRIASGGSNQESQFVCVRRREDVYINGDDM